VLSLYYDSVTQGSFMKISRLILSVAFGLIAILQSFSTMADENYRLHYGDAVFISVWGEETLQKEVKVLPDGSITFPLAGRVDVENVTTVEAQKRITEKLKVYLNDPQVTVVVTSVEGNKAYVIGKVLKAGAIPLTGPTTVLQALSLAGGFDKFAELSKIKVLRNVNNKQTVTSVNYERLIQGQNLESNLLLQPGDTILVP
jgi:polysaccharide export outer membrane protein